MGFPVATNMAYTPLSPSLGQYILKKKLKSFKTLENYGDLHCNELAPFLLWDQISTCNLVTLIFIIQFSSLNCNIPGADPGEVKWLNPPPPPHHFPECPSFSTSNTSNRLWFYYIVTKIHPPFQNPGSAPAFSSFSSHFPILFPLTVLILSQLPAVALVVLLLINYTAH